MEWRVNMVKTVATFVVVEALSQDDAQNLAQLIEDPDRIYHVGESKSWHAVRATERDMKYSVKEDN